ncbi:MAG: alkaline phosphatase family protein, partial [Cyanobacteriota bacterium]|nr:alkaline phosphatase family protein [Cyanobacteriota bacterium]
IFICLDGADRDLILKWTNLDLLPNLKKLLQKGAFGLTEDPMGINGCHWPTFLSGVSPVTHGRYWSQQIQPGTYEIGPTSFEWEPFWKVLSQAGCKMALIDPPESRICEGLNGIQVLEKYKPAPNEPRLHTYPSALSTEIEAKFGDIVIGSPRLCGRELKEIRQFCQNLTQTIENKKRLSSYFLNQDNWDFFLTSFRESHWVGHQCWHLHDPNHPEYDPKVVGEIGNPIQDIYIKIDSAIGEILKQAPSEATVFVFASTSMESNYTGVHLLDEILLRLENPKTATENEGMNKSINFLKQFKFLRQLKKSIQKRTRKQKDQKKQWSNRLVHRKFFQVPISEAFGGIRLNLVGREPQGLIQPGQEYEAVCESLCQDLRALVNEETGEPLIRNILKSSDIYQGDYPIGYPDLLFEWNRNTSISSVYSQKIGTIKKVYWDSRTGDHKGGGLFVVTGSGIKPGQVEQRSSIVDFAPTVASILGVELPKTDGKSIAEAIDRETSLSI